jgi:glycosyltransferase involved in cell wall biosynthesis
MGKIKVAHVITRFDKGGSAENTFLTVQGLDKEKYDVLLIMGLSLESRMSEKEEAAVAKNLSEAEKSRVRIMTLSSLVRSVDLIQDIKAICAMMSIFKNERLHIVHTHTSKAGFLGRWAAFFAKVPIIVHTPHGHVFWGYFNRWKTSLFILLERLTARITDRIITLTEQEKKDHLRFSIAPEGKFTVIHSGVDLTKFTGAGINASGMRKNLGIPENAFVVGTVGRLTAVKGHKYLIEAAAKVVQEKPDAHFAFLGDGELLDEFKKMVYSLDIENHVHFLGWRPDVAEIMATFDIFVLPSLNEGMGKVLVEAMAMGKPIIASHVGGIPDLVHPGENGFLVPPEDAMAIAEAIKVLYSESEKRRNMGKKGRTIATHYGVEMMVQKIGRLYYESISDRKDLLS